MKLTLWMLLSIGVIATAQVPILTLKAKTMHVKIHSNAGVTLYTVTDESGNVVADKIDIKVLEANFPEAHDMVKKTHAGNMGELYADVP